MTNRRQTYFGNAVPATVEDEALWTISPHDDNNRGAFGESLVGQLFPLTAWRFDYGTTPNTRLYNTTGTANGGTAVISESRLQLDTTAAVNGIARLSTQRRLRYLPGMGGLVRFTAAFSAPKLNSHQIVGYGDTLDGFFFGYQDNTFGVFVRRAGVDTFTSLANWNGTTVDFNPALGNVYQIKYQWLGFGFIRFYIMHSTYPTRGFILAHTVLYPNTSLLTSILNPTLPMMAEVANTGNNTNIRLLTPSAAGFLEGVTGDFINPLDVHNSFDAAATFADTANNHLLTIRNKATFAGVPNRVPVAIRGLNIGRSAAGANTSNIRLYRNATFAGALVYADIDASNSPVEASVSTTTVTSVNPEFAYIVTNNVTLQAVDYRDGTVVLQPGDSLTIGVQDSGVQSTDFVGTLNWTERF
jgi:hypothetical protein